MRLRAGTRVRYPDVVIAAGPLDPSLRTLTDAAVIFEVLSDDTARTDRVDKLIDYTAVPSLRAYVLLQQTAMAAAMLRREPGGDWIAAPHTTGALDLPAIDISLPLAPLYRGLNLQATTA